MNKSWIIKSRWSLEYNKGVEDILDFAGRSKNISGKILCPCKLCINIYFYSVQVVKEHIITNGFFTDILFGINMGRMIKLLLEIQKMKALLVCLILNHKLLKLSNHI
ncbi:hypothetical protein KFK09_008534 [Dendrobium nobile]|uniref:Transposase-associated domain-containing protein n=1 Tax=Dendrobium nobile TaxID=94219 RepID=A0A8T3BPS8_DENNO|nr:hypothetical protein KFK09_008534 [Dendrobium nobile]